MRGLRRLPWGIVASGALHLALLGLLLLLPGARLPKPPEPEPLDIELVTLPDAPPVEQQAPPAAAPPTELPPAPPPGPSMPAAGTLIHATRLRSRQLLREPQNAQARAELATLSGSEQQEQVCGIEAMEQIAAWREGAQPDRVIAYGRAATHREGNVIVADGAAYRSGKDWYALRFRCALAADGSVTGFEFAVGDLIPRSEWEASSIPDESGGDAD